MGTNFYLKPPSCPHCGRGGELLHIGKSSAGWNFGLRVYPRVDGEPNDLLRDFGVAQILELDDWEKLFQRFEIVNEYGETATAPAMIQNIAERSHPRGLLSQAHANRGTRYACEVGARGTYDLIPYEFS